MLVLAAMGRAFLFLLVLVASSPLAHGHEIENATVSLNRARRQISTQPHVQPLLNPPIPTSIAHYLGADQKIDSCERDKVLVQGGCHSLLTRGPCAEDEYVLIDPADQKGFCAPRLCSPDRIFVFSDQLCHDPRNTLLCPPGRQLYQTAYGTPVCQCPDGTYEGDDDLDDDVCEPLLGRTLECPPGQVLWFRDFSLPPECLPDPCGGKNLNRGPNDLPFVPSATDGMCYQLGQMPAVCPAKTWYTLALETLRGVCESLEDAGYQVFDEKMLTFLTNMYGSPIPRETTGPIPTQTSAAPAAEVGHSAIGQARGEPTGQAGAAEVTGQAGIIGQASTTVTGQSGTTGQGFTGQAGTPGQVLTGQPGTPAASQVFTGQAGTTGQEFTGQPGSTTAGQGFTGQAGTPGQVFTGQPGSTTAGQGFTSQAGTTGQVFNGQPGRTTAGQKFTGQAGTTGQVFTGQPEGTTAGRGFIGQVGTPSQGFTGQPGSASGQGFVGQGFPEQGFASQGFTGQGLGFSEQGFPGQAFPGQSFPGQAFPGQSFPGQSFPSQSFPSQAFPSQAFPGHGALGQKITNTTGQGFSGQTGAITPGLTGPTGQVFKDQTPSTVINQTPTITRGQPTKAVIGQTLKTTSGQAGPTTTGQLGTSPGYTPSQGATPSIGVPQGPGAPRGGSHRGHPAHITSRGHPEKSSASFTPTTTTQLQPFSPQVSYPLPSTTFSAQPQPTAHNRPSFHMSQASPVLSPRIPVPQQSPAYYQNAFMPGHPGIFLSSEQQSLEMLGWPDTMYPQYGRSMTSHPGFSPNAMLNQGDLRVVMGNLLAQRTGITRDNADLSFLQTPPAHPHHGFFNGVRTLMSGVLEDSPEILSQPNAHAQHHRTRRNPLPHATPGNVFETRLVACRAGAVRDINAKCRNTVLPAVPPVKRDLRAVPPVAPRPGCPTGQAYDRRRRCVAINDAVSSINAFNLGK